MRCAAFRTSDARRGRAGERRPVAKQSTGRGAGEGPQGEAAARPYDSAHSPSLARAVQAPCPSHPIPHLVPHPTPLLAAACHVQYGNTPLHGAAYKGSSVAVVQALLAVNPEAATATAKVRRPSPLRARLQAPLSLTSAPPTRPSPHSSPRRGVPRTEREYATSRRSSLQLIGGGGAGAPRGVPGGRHGDEHCTPPLALACPRASVAHQRVIKRHLEAHQRSSEAIRGLSEGYQRAISGRPEAISGNQWPLRGHQRHSGTQRSSEALTSTQRQSQAITCTQTQSEAITGTQQHSAELRERREPRRPR